MRTMTKALLLLLTVRLATAASPSFFADEPVDPPVFFCYPLSDGTDWITCEDDWNDVQVFVRAPDFEAASVDFYLDGRWLCSTHTPKGPGSNRFEPTAGFSSITSGRHVFKARAIGKGGIAAWTRPVPFVVDRIPVVTILSPKEGFEFWRPFKILAVASDDYGVVRVSYAGRTLSGMPYEAEESLINLPGGFLEYIYPRDEDSGQECVEAEDASGLKGVGCVGVRQKRLYFPDSPCPTFQWYGFFQKVHPDVRQVPRGTGGVEFLPDSYSTEWSVVLSSKPDFERVLASSPLEDGRFQQQWQPTEEEWLTIWGEAIARPAEDLPVYFRVIDGRGQVLYQNYFVLSKAEPASWSRPTFDDEGHFFPCGDRTDHDLYYSIEVADNPEFEKPPLFVGARVRDPDRLRSYPCNGFNMGLERSTACALQSAHSSLYFRYRAWDVLGRETVTQSYRLPLWPKCD